MAMCERCWGRAYMREQADTSKSQAEHYYDILAEQDRLGREAECPVAQAESNKGTLDRRS